MTRRLLLLLCLCSLLCASAAAYVVTIDAPRTLAAGEPLVVNGTSTLPSGYTHDLVVYLGSSERARTTIVVQADGTFSATFDTTGFPSGDYKVEFERPAKPSLFGSSSVMIRNVAIVDRSGEVVVTSPTTQTDVRNLTVSGIAAGKRSGSIAVAVTGPGNFSFGPANLPTDANGAFSTSVSITGPGEYRVVISDPAGVIARHTVTVAGEAGTGVTATVTATGTANATTTAVPVTTATTQAGLPALLVCLGVGLGLLARRR